MYSERFLNSFLTVLACALQLAACGGSVVQDQVELSPAADGHWNVKYRLARPSASILLARTPDDSRIRRWHTISTQFEIVQIDKKDVVRRKDGATFSVVDIVVPATYVSLPKDYAPFAPFTDGGLLIHSGRFQWCPTTAIDADDNCDGPWLMQIAPPAGAHVILNGERHGGSTKWTDTNDGTYVYVGTANALESPHVVAIVDPALPSRIAQLMSDLLPHLMDHYDRELPPLRNRPMLFVSYDPSFSDGHGNQGGTLPDQIFMHFYGSGWADSASNGFTAEDTAWFFAHEVAHLFQHGVSGELDASWIHEGAAEAFAYLILASSESVSKEYLTERSQQAEEGCRKALERGTLATAAARGQFSDYYECGLVMYLAIDSTLRKKSSGQEGLFSFWRRLIADADGHEALRNEVFLDYLQQFIGTSATDKLRSLIIEQQHDPGAVLQRIAAM